MLRNREDAEDVMQESICRAFMNLQQFRGNCTFAVWFTRIAINTALMLIRKRKVRPEVSYDSQSSDGPEWQWEFPDESPNAEKMCIKSQAIERMRIAVDSLPPRYRELVRQYHGTEQSLEETAGKLGLNISTAKGRLLRARLKMRTQLTRQKISFADACR